MNRTPAESPVRAAARATAERMNDPAAVHLGATDSLHLASIGLRTGAFLLDYIVTMFVPAVTVLLAAYFKRISDWDGWADIIVIFGYLTAIAAVLINLIYLCEGTGQSFGKRFIGIRIVRADGGPVDYRTVALRHLLGYLLSLIPFGLGFAWALWDSRQQGWHDKLARTIVVKV
jgi:uncharacterized RDD family membrane protein YckC